MRLTTFFVSPLDSPERLDLYLSRATGFTRARIKTLVEDGHILLNGQKVQKAGVKLRGGERVEVRVPAPRPSGLKKEKIPLEILYEDDLLLAVNKPSGLVVHPAAGHWEGTLVNALLYRFQNLSGLDPERPGIVHRLDKDTSGVLLVAKTEKAHLWLSRQFKERSLEKYYRVLVHGRVLHEQGIIEKPIGRHPRERKKMAVIPSGRPAVTRYRVLRRFKEFTLLECKIETGRTHQIRVHLSSIGHPVAGDSVYGHRDFAPRQLLHASRIRFLHPSTGRAIEITAPIPSDFEGILKELPS